MQLEESSGRDSSKAKPMIHVVADVTMCEDLVSQNLNSLPQ
jgi:hypothetical protein